MKQKTKSTLTITALLVTLGFSPQAFGVVYFRADFNDSTAITEETGLVANATIANLNAGTQVGAWAFTGAADASIPRGAIVSNPSNTDNAFVFDQGISGGDDRRAAGLFASTVDIASGDFLRFEFDIFATRQGAPDNGRQVRLALTNSTGLAGGGRAYVLIFNQSAGGDSKEFRWLDVDNNQVSISSQADVGFLNAAVDNYQTWDWADGGGNSTRVRIDVLGQTTVAASGGALVSIDWNGDGTWDTFNSPIGGRDAGVTSIDRFELFYSGTNAKGAFIDNIIAVPEPSVALLGAFGLLGLLHRRR